MARTPVIVRTRIAALCLAHGGQTHLAWHLGISEGYLSRVRRGEQEPGEAILRALGLREDRDARGYIEREA